MKNLLKNHEYYCITSLYFECNVFSGLQPRQSVGVFCGIRHQSYWISFIAMFKLRIVYQRHVFQRLCILQRTKSPIHGIGSQQAVCYHYRICEFKKLRNRNNFFYHFQDQGSILLGHQTDSTVCIQ